MAVYCPPFSASEINESDNQTTPKGSWWRAGWCCEGDGSSLYCRMEPSPAVLHHEGMSVIRVWFCGTNLPSAHLGLPHVHSYIPLACLRKCRSGNVAQCTFEMEEHEGRSGLSTHWQDEQFSSVLGFLYHLRPGDITWPSWKHTLASSGTCLVEYHGIKLWMEDKPKKAGRYSRIISKIRSDAFQWGRSHQNARSPV